MTLKKTYCELMILSFLPLYTHTHTQTCGNRSLRKGRMPAGYETSFQPEDVFDA